MPPTDTKGPQLLTPKIKCSEVRLIDDEDNRVVSREEAERIAEETGLDLVIMSLTSDPPVVKLTDYGKFKFEAEKKAREAKKKQHVMTIKEVKMGIRIDKHDYGVKLAKAKRFLEEGDKIKCTIRLKGREVQHANLAFDLAERFVADLEDVGMLEGYIRQESFRQLTLNIQPGTGKGSTRGTPVVSDDSSNGLPNETGEQNEQA